MIKSTFFLSFFITICLFVYGQKSHEQASQIWGGYMTSVRFHDKWALWNDAHYVPNAFWINRHGFSYLFTEKIVGTFGYAWLNTATSVRRDLIRAEHRPWGQINFLFKINQTYSFNHRLRYDYRLREDLTDGLPTNGTFTGNHRVRFMTSIRRPLIGNALASNKPFVSVSNEILVNFGQSILWNHFDQNRLWVNVGYQYKNITFQMGYMNRFVQLGRIGHTATYHTALLWITHTFDTRKKGIKQETPPTDDYQMLHREP